MDLAKLWDTLVEGWRIKIFLAGAFTFLFGEYHAGLGAVAVLFCLDFASRIAAISVKEKSFWKAFFLNAINSKGMRKAFPKLLWYMTLLIVAHQLNSFAVLGYTAGNVPSELICAYLGLIEAKSILENLQETGMKGLEPFIGFLGKKQDQITGKKD